MQLPPTATRKTTRSTTGAPLPCRTVSKRRKGARGFETEPGRLRFNHHYAPAGNLSLGGAWCAGAAGPLGEFRKAMSMWEPFTERARRSIVLAQEEAQRLGNNYIGTEHILLGIISEGESLAAKVLETLGVNLAKVRQEVEAIVGRGGQTVQQEMVFTPRAKRVIELAFEEARQLNHNYIGTEHLLLGLIREGEGVAARVLTNLGVDPAKVRVQTTSLLGRRGPAARAQGQVQDPDPGRLRARPDHPGAREQARPGDRPGDRDRAGHPDPQPPDQEQPGPDRRARRRQDGDRRGPGPARHQERGPRAAARQAGDHARPGRPGRRHQVPRRVRGAHEARHGRDPRRRRRDHPLHRRAPHPGRGRRRRGRDRRLEHHQAGARPRRAAVHRRDDPQRVPQAHREGLGARAPLPAGDGRRADSSTRRSRSSRACATATRRTTRSPSRTRRWSPRPSSATATSPTASCPTRRST